LRTARKSIVCIKHPLKQHSTHHLTVYAHICCPSAISPPSLWCSVCGQPQPHRVRGNYQQACTVAFIVHRHSTNLNLSWAKLALLPEHRGRKQRLCSLSLLADVPSSHDFPPRGCLACFLHRAGSTDSSAVRPLQDNDTPPLPHSYLQHHD
jgi:hypothetical protein